MFFSFLSPTDIPGLLGTDYVGIVSTEREVAEALDVQAPDSCTGFRSSVRSLCNSSASLFGATVKQSQGLPSQHVVDTQHPAGGLFRPFVAKEGAPTVAC